MTQQIPLAKEAGAALEGAHENHAQEIMLDLAYRRLAIVNVVFLGLAQPMDAPWVLVDAGLIGTKGLITRAAQKRFRRKPAAIVMTHGHFDHVGALEDLAREWDVPVYAHPLEMPYLSGQAAYPPGEPAVGGGLMAALAGFYPTHPVNVGPRLRPFSEDGAVPFMPGWQWIHTPGHSVGHVSLWQPEQRTLVAGDAFVTTAQESAYAVAVQRAEMHGPPMYFTVDWQAARTSVRRLAALEPEIVITGHGEPMQGPAMRQALRQLADSFEGIAVPKQSRYLDHPARAEDGSAYRSF
jgi:glyoxylase-like metal-dependent hydrolase (beta-lactamase superfamily II)